MSRQRSAELVPAHLYGLRRGTTVVLTVISSLFALFILGPLIWLVINATKDKADVYDSFGFWFSGPFRLFQNVAALG